MLLAYSPSVLQVTVTSLPFFFPFAHVRVNGSTDQRTWKPNHRRRKYTNVNDTEERYFLTRFRDVPYSGHDY
jgi:hypothetical protein